MKRALISVYNKEGIVEFAKELESLNWEIISTGGTYKLLKEKGIKNVKSIEEITDFPEIMDGRVKTLHPKIFGGILADRSKGNHLSQAEENQIPLIDLVVVNLYPFEKEASIENIDIGGVALVRAAAKNYQDVTVVVNQSDYQETIECLKIEDRRSKTEDQRPKIKDLTEFRKKLALKAFNHTAKYDELIANYFSDNQNLDLHFQKVSDLRYGENPHQSASFFKEQKAVSKKQGVVNAEILHGKELSFNNILDADSALALIGEFDEPAAAVIKHTNPCGCAVSKNINDAFKKAYAGDSLSAFGGVIVLNRECTKEIAEAINQVFAEIVIAPGFDDEALGVLKQKKNIRLLKIEDPLLRQGFGGQERSKIEDQKIKDYKKVIGGLLEQDYNDQQVTKDELKIVTKEKPTDAQIKDLLFAWKVVKHVKSNAIIIVKNGATIGIGAGQMSRIDAVELAVKKGGDKVVNSVAASDGFFPFRDGLDKLAQNGVKSIIQPGGSIKDKEVIIAGNELGLSMVFTNIRAFKH